MVNREYLLQKIQLGATRLGRLVDLDAPDVVMANEVAMLLKAMMAVNPTAWGRAMAGIIAEPMRYWYGCCARCLASLPDGTVGYDCPACEAKQEKAHDEMMARNPGLKEELNGEGSV